MHFALCLWGIVRSLRYTINSLRQYCLNPITNGGHTYEIYMHTYKFKGSYSRARSHEVNIQLNFSEWSLLNPDHIYVEDQDLFDSKMNLTEYQTMGDPWHNNYESFRNHLRALNSLNYLATTVEKDSKHKHFDALVFLRPDATYLNELPYYLMEHFQDTLFLPDFHRSCQGGEYNDRMAMGDLRSALVYGKRYQNALEYSRRKPLHSETFTYDTLHEGNVTVKEIPFRFKRTRANGAFHVRDEKAIVSPRQQKPEQQYKTTLALRMVYTVLEEVTNHKVYIWNHDDHENLYCKPNPYLSLEDCIAYRRKSRHKRLKGLLSNQSAALDPDDGDEEGLLGAKETTFAHRATGQRAEISGVLLPSDLSVVGSQITSSSTSTGTSADRPKTQRGQQLRGRSPAGHPHSPGAGTAQGVRARSRARATRARAHGQQGEVGGWVEGPVQGQTEGRGVPESGRRGQNGPGSSPTPATAMARAGTVPNPQETEALLAAQRRRQQQRQDRQDKLQLRRDAESFAVAVGNSNKAPSAAKSPEGTSEEATAVTRPTVTKRRAAQRLHQ